MSEKASSKEPKRTKYHIFAFYISLFLVCFACWAGPLTGKAVLDTSRYITVDEVRPGMDAYCLTAYKGTKIEKFGLEVLSVVHNFEPGKDAILVQGTDERFIHTGPVGGCSGSPVYIDGRLAGALAFGWHYSKDPLYGVTPIEEMLQVGTGGEDKAAGGLDLAIDFSQPISLTEVYNNIKQGKGLRPSPMRSTLPCPLITSALPAEVGEELESMMKPFGFMTVSGIGGGSGEVQSTVPAMQDVKLVPGACLAVPLATGDITMDVIGTVTEVDGDKVYGFGHSFLGSGPTDLPMATGQIHTVVSNLMRSFKFGSTLEIVGALTADESAAVLGRIGAKAKMIPLTVTVDRYNDTQTRTYNCQIVNNQMLTPRILGPAVSTVCLRLGNFPPDHMIEYKVSIGLEDSEPIIFENVSTGVGLKEMLMASIGSVALLLNNPYKKVDITSMDFDVRVTAKDIASHIWSVDLSDSRTKAGEQIDITIVLESVLAKKKKYQYSLKIPDSIGPGKYELIICGGYQYLEFLRKTSPYKFTPENLPTLVEAINDILAIDRDRLYCLLVLPSGGVTLERAELPDLPATKALVLRNTKRTIISQPYPKWLEKSFKTGTVVVDKKVMRITVEK